MTSWAFEFCQSPKLERARLILEYHRLYLAGIDYRPLCLERIINKRLRFYFHSALGPLLLDPKILVVGCLDAALQRRESRRSQGHSGTGVHHGDWWDLKHF